MKYSHYFNWLNGWTTIVSDAELCHMPRCLCHLPMVPLDSRNGNRSGRGRGPIC